MSEIEKRTKQVIIRMTELEHEQLLAKKTKPQLATWIREFCLENSTTESRKKVKTADPKLLSQLAKIGGNLNQIAKQANTVDSTIEKIRVFAMLAEIQSQLDELLKYHDI